MLCRPDFSWDVFYSAAKCMWRTAGDRWRTSRTWCLAKSTNQPRYLRELALRWLQNNSAVGRRLAYGDAAAAARDISGLYSPLRTSSTAHGGAGGPAGVDGPPACCHSNRPSLSGTLLPSTTVTGRRRSVIKVSTYAWMSLPLLQH